jgi:DNA-binding transcriptional regulator YhcF (GntR family)
MIKLWLARGTSIPVREQLSAQFILGIVSRKLAPGERLPSVRELGRRLNLHANTISATYRDLAKRGWVTKRRGSGVFVRGVAVPEQPTNLDAFVKACLEEGLERGFSIEALRNAFANITQGSAQQQLVVVDPDPDLARILAVEIGDALGRIVPFSGCGGTSQNIGEETLVLAIEANLLQVSKALDHSKVRAVHLKSMQDMLIGQQRPTSAVLVAVASQSESILRWASKLLSALGFPADAILIRNARQQHWQDGLESCDIVAADVVTAALMSKAVRPVAFRLVSDEFLAEIRQLMTL